jgi:hypothetical protein
MKRSAFICLSFLYYNYTRYLQKSFQSIKNDYFTRKHHKLLHINCFSFLRTKKKLVLLNSSFDTFYSVLQRLFLDITLL